MKQHSRFRVHVGDAKANGDMKALWTLLDQVELQVNTTIKSIRSRARIAELLEDVSMLAYKAAMEEGNIRTVMKTSAAQVLSRTASAQPAVDSSIL